MATLSVTLPSFGPIFRDNNFHQIADLAKMAEQAGVDRIMLTDHVVMGEHTDRYPYGHFPFPPETAWLEPLASLAHMAAVTSRIRFSTKILIAPLRPAAVLAKTLATMDVLSQGRLEVGVGTGWQREEYEAAGVPWNLRGQRLTDTIAACQQLWRDSPASFHSPTINFDNIWCEPKPAQPDGIPIWVAGTLHPNNLGRLVERASGWIPPPYADLHELADGVHTLQDALAAAGRNLDGFGIQGDIDAVTDESGRPSIRPSMDAAPRWAAAGATTINVVMSLFCWRMDRAQGWFDDLAQSWEYLALR